MASTSVRCRCRRRSSSACRNRSAADRVLGRPAYQRSRCRDERQAFAAAVANHDQDAQRRQTCLPWMSRSARRATRSGAQNAEGRCYGRGRVSFSVRLSCTAAARVLRWSSLRHITGMAPRRSTSLSCRLSFVTSVRNVPLLYSAFERQFSTSALFLPSWSRTAHVMTFGSV
jgi:hypothetical protein